MPNINCASCGLHLLPYTSCTNEPGFTICKVCENDTNGLNFVKNKYKMTKDEQVAKLNAQIEALKEQIRAKDEDNFAGYLKGGVLNNIMEKQTAEIMEKFNDFVNKVNEKQDSLREFVDKSRSQTKIKVQNDIKHILVSEASNLITSAIAQNLDNAQRIKSCEAQREKIRVEMSSQVLSTAHKRENPENKTTIKFSPRLIQNIMNAYQTEINCMNRKKTVISQLIQEGQGLVRKLEPTEKKVEKKKATKNKAQESKLSINTEPTLGSKIAEDLFS